MSVASVLRSLGNKVYKHGFPIYRPLYAAYKAYGDRAERQLLKKVLFPGAVVVDAGANIGIYSQFLARCVGPTGAVHSFEPSPENFQRLRTVARELRNVRLSQAAVGERSGKSKLYISDKLNVDHRTYLADDKSRGAIPIEMVALDDYFQPGERVDMIKLDIQGYELHALRGAKRVLRENRDIQLMLEFWPYGLKEAGGNWKELIKVLRDLHMDPMLVGVDGLIPFQARDVRSDSAWYINLFASRGR